MDILVLGSGCAKCKRLEQLAASVLEELHMDVPVQKVTEFDEIMKFDILSTPALVINDSVMCSGRIPTREEVKEWITTTSIQL